MKKFALCLLAVTVASASTLVYATPPSPMDQKSIKEAVNVFQQVKQSVNPSPALMKQVRKSVLVGEGFRPNPAGPGQRRRQEGPFSGVVYPDAEGRPGATGQGEGRLLPGHGAHRRPGCTRP